LLRKLCLAALVVGTLAIAAISGYDAALQYWRREVILDATAGRNVPSFLANDPYIRLSLALPTIPTHTLSPQEAAALSADARTLLRADPINADALYALGMVAEQQREDAGLPLFLLAERLSRRQILNQLALESVSAARGDMVGAVARIDRIVTVGPDVAWPIFGSIAPALSDPAVRAAFETYAARPWYGDLVRSAVGNGVDGDTVLGLLRAGERTIDPAKKSGIIATLIRRAVNDHDFALARRLAEGLAPPQRQAVSDFGFSQGSSDPALSVLGWNLSNDATTSASIGNDGNLQISVSGEQVQAVAARMTLLAPGSYVLNQIIAHDPAAPRARLTWDMMCPGLTNGTLWHQPMPDRDESKAAFQSVIVVPVGCNVQDWRLSALGESGQDPSTARVGAVRLRHQ
jgi:hypothetical protein